MKAPIRFARRRGSVCGVPAARLPALVLLVCLAAGCAYSIHSSLDPRYQTVSVAAFQNASREYDLQAPLTNAVRRKFLTDGRLRVVDAPDADLLLEGVILDYRLKGVTYDAEDEVTQFLCLVVAGVRMKDGHSGEVLWQEERMVGETTFYIRAAGQSSDRLRGNAEAYLPTVRSFATEEENRAAAEALEQLASDIFYRTIEPW